jgi:hypothetical protein
LAAPNKSLAKSNKSRTGGKATKKRTLRRRAPVTQSHDCPRLEASRALRASTVFIRALTRLHGRNQNEGVNNAQTTAIKQKRPRTCSPHERRARSYPRHNVLRELPTEMVASGCTFAEHSPACRTQLNKGVNYASLERNQWRVHRWLSDRIYDGSRGSRNRHPNVSNKGGVSATPHDVHVSIRPLQGRNQTMVEGLAHRGMGRAKRLLPDRQCALVEFLRLSVLPLVCIDES